MSLNFWTFGLHLEPCELFLFFVLVINLNCIDLIGSLSTTTFSVLPPALKKTLQFILHYYVLHLSRFILHSAMTFWNSSYPDLLWHRKGAKRVNWIVFFCSFSLQTTPVLSTKTLVKDIWSCSWLTRDQISHLHYFLVAYQMYAHKYQYLRIYVITYLFHMNPIVIMHWIIMFSCSVLWKKERKKKIIFWYLGSFIYKQCLWSLLDGL